MRLALLIERVKAGHLGRSSHGPPGHGPPGHGPSGHAGFPVGGDGTRRWLRWLAQPVTYLGVAALASIGGALVFLIVQDRNEAYQVNARRADNVVRIIDQSFSHMFKRADASLLFLRNSYQRDASTFDLSAWTRETAAINELTIDFTVIDASGRIEASSRMPSSVGGDLSDRETFYVHAKSADDQLYISGPIITKVSRRRAIVLSRRLTSPDGTFAGVVVALIDPSELARQVGEVDLGPNGSVALVGFDGFVRTRVVDGKISERDFGRKLPSHVGILKYATRAKSGHYWNTPGVIDDVVRLVSFRVLDAFPLVALVSMSEAEVYRRAHESARIYYTIAAVLSIAVLIAIWLGARRERKLLEATSKLQEAKEALLRSQERYTLVENAIQDGIWDWDVVTDNVYVSPRWKRILGYAEDKEHHSRRAFLDLLHPDDRPVVWDAQASHLERNTPYALDFRVRCADGEYRWVHAHGKALRDPQGRPVRMLGAITDISERKRAEAAVEESCNNLARAEEMALIGHFKFEYGAAAGNWSDGIYRIVGKSRASFVPTPSSVLDIVHPDDRPILEEHRRNMALGIEPPRHILRMRGDDGQYRYIEGWTVPLRAADGAVTGMFGTLQDVTTRVQAEAALARANQELEQRVAERTAELAQEMRRREEAQMNVAQIQRLNAIGQLTAGIAHDFNNLLAVIGGGLEFIERAAARGLPAEPELIEASLRASRRGRELVQRLLTFARQSPLKAEPTNVDRLVLDTLRLLQRTLGEEIDIDTRLNAASAKVSVDRNQLTNALLNLTLNARDAMPSGGRLTIATACRPAECAAAEGQDRWPTGDEVCIVIGDTGTGMSEAVHGRAFEPFFTTKPDGLGGGLGLSMVHGFVEQSGGHIGIDSAVGRGTTITIRLPRIATAGGEDVVAAPDNVAVAKKEKTVLLVEDDLDVRIVTSAQLKQLGYNVHAVANGHEAMDLIASPADIDITLTDLVLPAGIDGVMLVEEAMRARPSMGVLCMSGYDPTQRHRKWLQLQNIELLEKPFSSARLGRALEDALGQ